MKQKILIFCTLSYSGGTLVLAELCRCLNQLGYDAKILGTFFLPISKSGIKGYYKRFLLFSLKSCIRLAILSVFPFDFVKRKLNYDENFPRHFRGCRRKWTPFFNKKKTIVLYPEYCYGNPLKAENVVRWMLFHYMYADDRNAYNDSDLFIGYRSVFNDCSPKKDVENVLINSFDDVLYKRTNFGERTGNCYIIRKGWNREDLPKTYDGPIIDDLTEEEKVATFNRCEYCFSYDTQTFYSSIASICGCKSVVLPEKGKTIDDYLKDNDPRFGIAFGLDDSEIERAERTRADLISCISNYHQSNIDNTVNFIRIVSEYFKTNIAKR